MFRNGVLTGVRTWISASKFSRTGKLDVEDVIPRWITPFSTRRRGTDSWLGLVNPAEFSNNGPEIGEREVM
jgi:hypothetical protein